MKYVWIKTGLTTHTIRAQETRYWVIVPERFAKNRGLYSDKDIEKLVLLKKLKLAGHSIGRIAGLSPEDLEDLILEEAGRTDEPRESDALTMPADTDTMMDEAMRHLFTFDG